MPVSSIVADLVSSNILSGMILKTVFIRKQNLLSTINNNASMAIAVRYYSALQQDTGESFPFEIAALIVSYLFAPPQNSTSTLFQNRNSYLTTHSNRTAR